MKPEFAEKFSDSHDFLELTQAVLTLCESYGPVHAFRMVHNRGAARVACVIEMESPKQQQVLARELGARDVHGEACVEIPVDKDFGCPRVVALASVPRAADFEARDAAAA